MTRDRSSSLATRTRRTPSATAAPTSRARCSSTGTRRPPTAVCSELARTFEGAWPYLELIAAANRIDDPLDPRVVDAYWVGNGLLDKVGPESLARHVEDRFRGRVGRGWQDILDAVAAGAVPHHSFHVFAVYPWLGLMRTGIVDEPLRVLDQCRTTPARVLAVEGDRARGARAAARLERARASTRPVVAPRGALARGRAGLRGDACSRATGCRCTGTSCASE